MHKHHSNSALCNEARALAVSLAQALVVSSVPEHEKRAWITLVPELRLDQLSQLAGILDGAVVSAAQANLADVLPKMRKIFEKHAAIQAQIDSECVMGVSAIVQELRDAESV